ncbi:glycosyltransferase [Phyllobacterium sp. K27]
MTKLLRTICVGTVTRNRPIMLQALLASYAEMTVPAGTQLHFLIVENNSAPTLAEIIERFRKSVPNCTVQYEIEPRLGIAFVRNRVLDNAISSGYDLLTFADDDETVQPDWLVELLAERDASDLDIVGGPVRLAPLNGVSLWKKMIWNALKSMMDKGERDACATKAKGQAGKLWIATNNWMSNLDFFRATGLRFDESLALNGGEDWRLYRQAKTIGANTGWAHKAIVHDHIPQERLTLAYQFKRSRDHCAIETRTKLATRKVYTLYRLPGSILARLLKMTLLLFIAPATPGESLVKAAAYLGSITGMLQAFTNIHSPHYQTVTGA